jgi:hypothetical protein
MGRRRQSSNPSLFQLCLHAATTAIDFIAVSFAFVLAGHPDTQRLPPPTLEPPSLQRPDSPPIWQALPPLGTGPAKSGAVITDLNYASIPNASYISADQCSSYLLAISSVLGMLTTSLTDIIWNAIPKKMDIPLITIKCNKPP